MMRWVLMVVLLVAAALPVPAGSADAPLERLRQVMAARLAVMEDVARTKWNENRAIEDLEREAVMRGPRLLCSPQGQGLS